MVTIWLELCTAFVPAFLPAGALPLTQTNSVGSLTEKSTTLHGLAHLGVFRSCLWPLKPPGYLRGGLPSFLSTRWCQYPAYFALEIWLLLLLLLLLTVGDAPLMYSAPDSRVDPSLSYDELRRLNRAEHDKKRFESLSRPSQPTQHQQPPAEPSEPPKPRKLQHA